MWCNLEKEGDGNREEVAGERAEEDKILKRKEGNWKVKGRPIRGDSDWEY